MQSVHSHLSQRNSKNLKSISDSHLENNLTSLVKKEREVLGEILEHLYEVERRKLYLRKAYPSLFSYLTEYLGYSAGSAHRRLEAVRLMGAVPLVKEKIEAGDLNLKQISTIQQSIRTLEKENPIPNSKEKNLVRKDLQNELVSLVLGRTEKETEVIIQQALNIQPQKQTRIHSQSDGSVRIEMTLTKRQWELLQQAQNLLSHSLPRGNEISDVIEHMSNKVVQKETKKFQNIPLNERNQKKEEPLTSGQDQLTAKSDMKGDVGGPNGSQPRCQYVDKSTGKRCWGRSYLQKDHIQPKWSGGSNSPENMTILCSNHNRQKYRDQAGISSG